jgi:hypothetical protein
VNALFVLALVFAYFANPIKRNKDLAFAYAGALSIYVMLKPYYGSYTLSMAFDLGILSYLLSRRGELTLLLSVLCSGGVFLTMLEAFRVHALGVYSPSIALFYEASYTLTYMAQVVAIFITSIASRYHLINKSYDRVRNPWFMRVSAEG